MDPYVEILVNALDAGEVSALLYWEGIDIRSLVLPYDVFAVQTQRGECFAIPEGGDRAFKFRTWDSTATIYLEQPNQADRTWVVDLKKSSADFSCFGYMTPGRHTKAARK